MDEELKTLKELKDLHPKTTIKKFETTLRKEAVKWVKEDKKFLVAYEHNGLGWDVREAWMRRLNITEKDLEEKDDKNN